MKYIKKKQELVFDEIEKSIMKKVISEGGVKKKKKKGGRVKLD